MLIKWNQLVSFILYMCILISGTITIEYMWKGRMENNASSDEADERGQ
jgi:hypothetical protein